MSLRADSAIFVVCKGSFPARQVSVPYASPSFLGRVPDEATQTLLQSFARHEPIGAMWTAHEESWIKFSPDDFKDRDLEPISDMRKFNQLARTLTKFRNNYCNVEPVNLQYYNQMTQEELLQSMH